MDKKEIETIKNALAFGRKVFWFSGYEYIQVISVTGRREEYGLPCANLKGGTFCLLENSEPSDFFVIEKLF